MTLTGIRLAKWRARIAFCAALLVLFSIADGFFCATEAHAHDAVSVTEDASDNGPATDGDCAYGHCHHVIPMPALAQAVAMRTSAQIVLAWRNVSPHSAHPPTLERPPKA